MKEKLSAIIENISSRTASARSFVDSRDREFRIVTLFVVFTLGLVTRLLPLQQITLTDASYSLTEAYRNLRNIRYTGENFPAILFTDLSSSVPSEVATETGGVIDILLGSIVAIGGTDVAIPLLHLIPVVSFVFLFAIVYKISSELFTPSLGVLSVTIMTIIPGGLYAHTVAGSGSVFGLEIAILLGFVYSLHTLFATVLQEVSILESVAEDYTRPDFVGRILSTTLLGVLVVGLTPQIALVVFTALAVSVFVYALRDSREVVTYEPISLVLLIPAGAMTLTVGVLSTVFTESLFSLSTYSLTQVLFGLALILTLTGTIAIPRYQETRLRKQDRWSSKQNFTTELSIFGVVVGGVLLATLQYSADVFQAVGDLIQSQATQQGGQAGSSGLEAIVLNEFGLIFFGAIIGGFVFYIAQYRRSSQQEYGATNIPTVYIWNLLVSTLGIIVGIAYAFNQSYSALLAVFVAIFTVYVIQLVVKYGDLDNPNVSGIKAYQVILVLMVLVLFIPGLFAPLEGTVVQQAQTHEIEEQSTVEVAEWIQDTDSIQSDQIYNYPQESPSSVLVTGNNPDVFAGLGEYPTTGETTESSQFTSRYLLSQSEDQAEQVANEYGSDPQYIAIDSSTALPNSEFIRLTRNHPNRSYQEFSQSVFSATTGEYTYNVNTDAYYNSLLNRLYFYHGAAQRPSGTTVAYQQNPEQGRATTYEVDQLLPEDHIRKFENQSEANRFIEFHSGELRQRLQEEENLSGEELDQRMSEIAEELGTEQSEQSLSIQQGGVGLAPTTGVDALEHYRYIASSQTSIRQDSLFLYQYQQIQRYMEEPRPSDFLVDPGKTKVFERVEGATVEGSGAPADSRVVVRVTLENTRTDIQFRYVQQVQTDENGNFETTLPYATENVPSDYTVRPYQDAEYEFISQQLSLTTGEDGQLSQNITRYEATQSVSEADVQDGETLSVTLEEVESPDQEQEQNTSEDQSN